MPDRSFAKASVSSIVLLLLTTCLLLYSVYNTSFFVLGDWCKRKSLNASEQPSSFRSSLELGSFYFSLDAGRLTTPTGNDTTGPLSGWTSSCPPTFLHSDPDLILGGYSRVYPDLQQPWKDAYEGWNHFRKCWAGPSPHPHNRPNWSSLLAPGSQQLSVHSSSCMILRMHC